MSLTRHFFGQLLSSSSCHLDCEGLPTVSCSSRPNHLLMFMSFVIKIPHLTQKAFRSSILWMVIFLWRPPLWGGLKLLCLYIVWFPSWASPTYCAKRCALFVTVVSRGLWKRDWWWSLCSFQSFLTHTVCLFVPSWGFSVHFVVFPRESTPLRSKEMQLVQSAA